APSGRAQERVIRAALVDAGIGAADVDVVEGHGTGTRLGDPIELGALLATYGRERGAAGPLLVGSVKSNIGHAQAAAGVAGVIKMVEGLRRGVVAGSLHVEAPTSRVDWSSGGVEVVRETVPWPGEVRRPRRPRRAGVSSFGMSGTNAHVILEEAPEEAPAAGAGSAEPEPAAFSLVAAAEAVPWVLSARSETARRAQARRLLSHLEGAGDPPSVLDVGRSLAGGRAALEHRAAVTGPDRLRGLRALAAGQFDEDVVLGHAAARGDDRVVWVFPGQGAQWAGMGAELLDASAVFAARVAECDRALRRFVDWSVLDVVRGVAGAPELESADVVQPVSWAVMVGLAAVWESWGVRPDVVVGHSQGEIAAACVAGVLSLEDAARVVAVRSRVIAAELAGRGGMVSVALPLAEVAETLERWEGRLEVAAVNGPSATTVAGEPAALAEILARWERDGARARRLPVDYASHTGQVERVRERLTAELAGVNPQVGAVAMWSTVTGGPVDPGELDGDYWYRNLRSTVRFGPVVDSLVAAGHRTFVEVSTHPVLTAAVTQAAEAADVTGAAGVHETVAVGSLRRDDGGVRRLAVNAAQLWAKGLPVDWRPLVAAGRPVDLPTYPFEHRRYWPEVPAPTSGSTGSGRARSGAGHPLLDVVTPLADTGGLALTGALSRAEHPWLADHAVSGTALLPATAVLELALCAGAEAGGGQVAELTLETSLVVPEHGRVHLQVSVGPPDPAGGRPLTVYSRPDQDDHDADADADAAPGSGARWTRHATGSLEVGDGSEPAGQAEFDLVVWPPRGAEEIAIDDLYPRLAASGVDYGPAFQAVRAVWRRGSELFAEVSLSGSLASQAGRFAVHPVLLDAALHPLVLDPGLGARRLRPFCWNDVQVHATGASSLRVRLSPVGTDEVAVATADATGQPVATGSLTLRPAPAPDPGGAQEGPAPDLNGVAAAEGLIDGVPVQMRPVGRVAAGAVPGPGPGPGGDGAPAPGAASAFARRLAELEVPEREQVLLDLVRGQAAAVLGHERGAAVADDRSFSDLGFDSLSGVEFRNRLTAITGLRLPAALVFNQPTPLALARYLRGELEPGRGEARGPLAELERLEAALAAIQPGGGGAGAGAGGDAGGGIGGVDGEVIAQRLQALLWRWNDLRSGTTGATGAAGGAGDRSAADDHDDEFDAMSDDEMLEAIDRELGAF
ncbi:acyltransferase domain-containing protein, partial [Frankia sp. Cpl3]|nr:acyltransferase domain-containing protein [Frankia sp. Cpl3]